MLKPLPRLLLFANLLLGFHVEAVNHTRGLGWIARAGGRTLLGFLSRGWQPQHHGTDKQQPECRRALPLRCFRPAARQMGFDGGRERDPLRRQRMG